MPGETWRGTFQIGKEATSGTAVAATRVLYLNMDSVLTRARAPRPHQFMTTTRDNTRAFTAGPVEAAGTVHLPLSSSEIIEWCLLGIAGGVTPTTPVGGTTTRLWTFKPSTTLDSATLQWHDGANLWQETGVRANQLQITGSVGGDNTVNVDLFGTNLATLGALTGALTQRTPDFFEGWETNLYIDNFGATPGTTAVPGVLINWDVRLGNNLGRKYTASNTLAASSVPFGVMDCTATLTFEASSAQAITEFNNWENGTATPTKRLVRLEFGQNAILEGTLRSFVTVDLPGSWSAFNLGQTDAGTRTYQLTYQYVYDATNAYGFQLRAQNARATAY